MLILVATPNLEEPVIKFLFNVRNTFAQIIVQNRAKIIRNVKNNRQNRRNILNVLLADMRHTKSFLLCGERICEQSDCGSTATCFWKKCENILSMTIFVFSYDTSCCYDLRCDLNSVVWCLCACVQNDFGWDVATRTTFISKLTK